MGAIPMISMLVVVATGALVVLALGYLFYLAARAGRENRPHPSELDRTGRAFLASVDSLRESLRSLARDLKAVPELRALAEEVVREADHAHGQAARLVEARTAVQKSLRGRAGALQRLSQAQIALDTEMDAAQRPRLESALQARQAEVDGYRKIEDNVRAIEAKLQEAESGLAELNSRMAVAASSLRQADASEELGGLAQRLRSLGSTLDEATELIAQGRR
jgi:chromosome segregation ATPase